MKVFYGSVLLAVLLVSLSVVASSGLDAQPGTDRWRFS
jgi:hypothetical protein